MGSKKVNVSFPMSIQHYNKHMGGTDLTNQNMNAYRVGIRGKKWWRSVFTWLLDSSLQNAWQLYRGIGGSASRLDFRREIAMTHLSRNRNPPKTSGRKSQASPSVLHMRGDGKDHLVQPVPHGKKRRCAADYFSSTGRTECRKCDVGLCVKCFVSYHSHSLMNTL